MNSRKYVFAQLLQFISRYDFDKCVARYKGDCQTRDFNCWNQFIQMFFGLLTSRNSLRDTCNCLKAYRNKLYRRGIRKYVNQFNLSRANEHRNWRIFADFAQHLTELVSPLYANDPISGVELDNEVFALDWTTNSLSLKLVR